MSSSLRVQPPERFGPAEDHEPVAAADNRDGFGIECHAQIAALNADDDQARRLPPDAATALACAASALCL